MLVLTRTEGESIMIGNIEVKVVRLNANKVRLGVEAPHHVIVDRKEIWLEKHRHDLPTIGTDQ